MPTLAGLRRRGVPPEAIRDFVKRIGVAKANSDGRRRHVRARDPRRAQPHGAAPHGGAAAAQGGDRELSGRAERGARGRQPSGRSGGRHAARSASAASSISSATTSWRTRRRSSSACRPAREVRLRYAYFITCREVVKNAAGEVVELRCTYDPATRGGNAPDGRKVQATMHWVSAADAVTGRGAALQSAVHASPTRAPRNFAADLNPNSLEVLTDAMLEPALAGGNAARAGAVRAPGLFLPRPGLRRRASRCSTARSACATPGRR